MAYLVTDIECYSNYFLMLSLDPDTGTIYRWEKHDDLERGRTQDELRDFIRRNITITFNGLGYDWPMLSAYLKDYSNAELKELSDYLIKIPLAQWSVEEQFCLRLHAGRHIDIFPVAPLVASLKIYAGRLQAPKLQDLPVSPTKRIDEQHRDVLIDYCINDVHSTSLIHKHLKPQILLRHRMSKDYGLKLTSKSDPQIAEAVIKKLLNDVGVKAKRQIVKETVFYFDAPQCVEMLTYQMRRVLKLVCQSEFEMGKSGRLLCPKILKEPMTLGESEYTLGMGGLHSTEKRRTIRVQPGEYLTDLDVTSYYPNLILTNGLYPEMLGKKFLAVYESLVEQRIAAKQGGDKITNDALKIVINSSFGKFGNKYSVLYSPKLLLQTTFTGQLYLLMLIEMIELRTTCKVVSANTDGITVHAPNAHQYNWMMRLTRQWEAQTQMQLEATQYTALFSQDVNNYVAVKPDGSLKRKGLFATPSLMKSPSSPIVQDAAIEFLTKGIRPEHTVTKCRDIRKFCSLRKVTGGALFRDVLVGATVRWYHSIGGAPILYARNFNRVPETESSQLLSDLPDTFPQDVDLGYYINKATDLIDAVGGFADSPFDIDELSLQSA